MQVSILDRYRNGDTLIHQLDPRVKVVITVLYIVANVALPDGAWAAFLASWGMVMLGGWLASLPAGYLIKRSFIAIPFALAAVTVIFTVPGDPLLTWQWGSATMMITAGGVIRLASIILRSWLSVQMAILLTAVTQFPDLMHALHHLRVPRILISIISFMYRYLFVLVDEAMRLLRARQARSARPSGGGGGGSLLWRARVAGNMVGQLFLRSLERSERVYNAMLARGYQGQLLTMNPHLMSPGDWFAAALAVLLIAMIQLIAHLL